MAVGGLAWLGVSMLVLPLLPLPLPCSLASGGRESAGGWSCFWSCCLFGSWLVDGIVVLPVCGQPSVWEDLALCSFPCCCRWVECPRWRLGFLGIALGSPLVDVSFSGRQRAPGDTQLRCLERTPRTLPCFFLPFRKQESPRYRSPSGHSSAKPHRQLFLLAKWLPPQRELCWGAACSGVVAKTSTAIP